MFLHGWQPTKWRHTWTEEPVSAVWHDLGLFAYPANVIRYLRCPPDTDRPCLALTEHELADKAQEVAVCIAQGRDFFNVSQAASAETAPLVLYYGALCLAKAVAIANLPGVRHDDTGFRYHGLTSRASCCADPVERSALQQYGQDSSRWAVTKEFAILHGGVFPRLVEALAGWAPGPGKVVYLRDLLTRLPSLIPHAQLHLGNAPAIAKLYSSLEPTKDDPNTLVLAIQESDVARVRGELLGAGFTEEEGLHHSQARRFTVARQTAEALTSLGVEHHPLGPKYLYGHVPGTDAWWPQPAVCLAALWILSETVRYRPVLWRRTIGPDAEGLLPLVEAFLSDVRRAYPNYILTALEGRRVTYGPATYYT